MLSKKIRRVLRPLNKARYFAASLKGLDILASLLPPYLMGILIDDLNQTGGSSAPMLIAAILGILAAYFVLDWMQDYLWNKMIYKGTGMVRSYLFHNVLYKEYRFFADKGIDHTIGDIENKVIHDAAYYAKNRLVMIPMLLLSILHIGVILAFLFAINVPKTLATVAFSAAFYLLYRHINKHLRKNAVAEREGFSELLNTANETLMGINTIQLYTQEEYFANRFEHSVDKYEDFLIRLRKWQALAQSVANNIMVLMPVAAVGLGIFFAAGGYISIGGIVAFYLLLPRLSEPIKNLTDFNMGLQHARAVESRLTDLLDTTGSNDANLEKIDKIRSLEFSNISYGYEDSNEEVLHDISFKLAPGDALAIVGPSGTGKTTFLRMLKRQVSPTTGEILINGKSHHAINTHSYIDRIAVLTQEVFVFDGTIGDNVRFGKDIPDEKIAELMTLCALSGYNLNESAKNLSGGERQRMGLARALACEYDILILDEPTSDLDAATETVIIQNLKALQAKTGAILIIVTHSDNVLKNLCNKNLTLGQK
ncbi:MAG: ABC transporter ATP-binding protein/permease [Defluviitaleaceae bacterium]|nr:ABC transporter ATP-binding protein/permease [Defluviitaleaceae bacterium]